MERYSSSALIADEGALEEGVAGDEFVADKTAEWGDAALGGDEPGEGAAGIGVGGQLAIRRNLLSRVASASSRKVASVTGVELIARL